MLPTDIKSFLSLLPLSDRLPAFLMLLERFDAFADISDPNIIIGPCKHQPTEHLLENRDPLVHKRARKANINMSGASANKENLTVLPPSSPSSVPPSSHAGDQSDSDDGHEGHDALTSDDTQVIMLDSDEETDEDDDSKLGI